MERNMDNDMETDMERDIEGNMERIEGEIVPYLFGRARVLAVL
jgi:hypothetical protein